jgi:(p)ppGpp synthase/HD superfamily hydrolase
MVFPEKSPQQANEIQEAVVFLVTRMLESGHNPKPVIFHSIRVGVHLYNLNYESDIVKAGILHDIIEDSDTSLAEVAERFGEKVAELVQANTFDYTVGDRAAQGVECFQRCLKCGRDALVVKAADRLENSHYWSPTLPKDFSEFWVAEMRHEVDISRPILKDEPIWQELNRQCQRLEAALKQI